ncbi:hypothetical protein DL96DRAFT_1702483 [Flagelloscypha sp. PMI_526]|nr:hypothetical protein DL96DRAFT_1702483 [Flagelloscypha sp. PMI_526]
MASSQITLSYTRLFRGEVTQTALDKFFHDMFALSVDKEALDMQLSKFSKDQLVQTTSPTSSIFCTALSQVKKPYDERRHRNAVDTLAALLTSVVVRHPSISGYEASIIFAGSMVQSDKTFSDFVSLVESTISHPGLDPAFRHQVLQLGFLFMLRMSQLSPGAYFLRRDIFPSLCFFIKDPDTTRYTFEAVLFLTLLSNFHKQNNMSKQNIYLKHLTGLTDRKVLGSICWAANYVLQLAIDSYRQGEDTPSQLNYLNPVDSFMSLSKSILKVGTDILPLPALLGSSPADSVKSHLQKQPIEGAVICWTLYEVLLVNPSFPTLLIDSIDGEDKTQIPLVFSVISLSSFLFSHATSIDTSRSFDYAALCMALLDAMLAQQAILDGLLRRSADIILCRQREPPLPSAQDGRLAICALLDCCVLWLRHNLAKRFPVHQYTLCVRTCYRAIYELGQSSLRLEYHWKTFWDALIGLLQFLSSRLEDLATTGGVEILLRETLSLLDLCLQKCEAFLPTPQAVHEFMYELAAKSNVIKKQPETLNAIADLSSKSSLNEGYQLDALDNILATVEFYERQIVGARTASQAISTLGKLIEADGLYLAKQTPPQPLPASQDMLFFIRTAYRDCLALVG